MNSAHSPNSTVRFPVDGCRYSTGGVSASTCRRQIMTWTIVGTLLTRIAFSALGLQPTIAVMPATIHGAPAQLDRL